ncbi:MAG TPA: metallopeptidase TldD-related protein [Phycisphaerae bacterium]|nr:metallopeptidase TldD-related protein [Phycisphaerae bacterium]
MTDQRFKIMAAVLVLGVTWALPALADDTLSDGDVIMRAMVDEMNRSMELQMEDLEKPYFLQYTVEDTVTYRLAASYGAITTSDRDRSRDFYGRVRVGSYELDNTNFSGGGGGFFGRRGRGGGGGGGGRASLPIQDDYEAIRQAIWSATDDDYKGAVETLTQKRAYMEDKKLTDRPDDFSKVPAAEASEPGAVLAFDKAAWEENLEKISGHFRKYAQVQDSKVQLYAGAGNAYVANSEGTRVRTADTITLLIVSAEVQADDGMKISDSRSYVGDSTADLPPLSKIIDDADALVAELTTAMKAPILEQYTGPVLFDGRAAGQLFREMLAKGVAGRVDPVGTQRRMFEGAESLEKMIGQRILPKSIRVYDDPTTKKVGEKLLFGHYRYDDEGVPARKVDIVVDGKLQDMVMCRVPTKKLSGSNGHGRSAPGGGTPEAAIGCLFIEDEDAIPDAQLKEALIEAAGEAGLEYGLRVASIKAMGIETSQAEMISFFMRRQQGGRQSGLGDPIFVYKVYVDDGREELVRGSEFGAIKARDLKDIIAAGDTPTVYNYIGLGFTGATPRSTIVAPPVLFEELELSKIEQEHDKLPLLKAPLVRAE